jgi:hypothetical protein
MPVFIGPCRTLCFETLTEEDNDTVSVAKSSAKAAPFPCPNPRVSLDCRHRRTNQPTSPLPSRKWLKSENKAGTIRKRPVYGLSLVPCLHARERGQVGGGGWGWGGGGGGLPQEENEEKHSTSGRPSGRD